MYTPERHNYTENSDIDEFFDLDVKINDDSIYFHYGELDENGNYNSSIKVKLDNHKDEDLPIKDYFDNNWWCISGSRIYSTLGLVTEEEESSTEFIYDESPLLDKVISELGGPKHIYKLLEMELEEGEYIAYELCYEYPEFSIVIDVREQYVYDRHICEIESIEYAPNEYWENWLQYMKKTYTNCEIIK